MASRIGLYFACCFVRAASVIRTAFGVLVASHVTALGALVTRLRVLLGERASIRGVYCSFQ